jgi:hypothetical protein
LLVLGFASSLWAGPWSLIAGWQGFSVLDLATSPITQVGFFKVPPPVQLFDVEPYPNNCSALFSSFDTGIVFRFDTTDPAHPFQSGALDLSTILFAPLDMAIPEEGGFAVAGEGEDLNRLDGRLVLIDLTDPDFESYSVYRLRTQGAAADAVAVTPDGRTVIICDSFFDRIIFGRVNASKSGLESESILPTASLPINVAISPDGRTALVTDLYGARLSVFRIDGPGVVVPGSPPECFAHWYPQSVAFSADGSKAYVYSTSYNDLSDKFSWYSIDGPGRVGAPSSNRLNLMTQTGIAYFGVDFVAITPDGSEAIVGGWGVGYNIVFLNAWSAGENGLTGNQGPIGVAMLDAAFVYAPAEPTCTRLVNDFIFYKEYINRLTWGPNPKNLGVQVTVRIYRKPLGASDSAFELLGEFDGSVTSFDDRGLRKDQDFVYRFTSVLATGVESPPFDLPSSEPDSRGKALEHRNEKK